MSSNVTICGFILFVSIEICDFRQVLYKDNYKEMSYHLQAIFLKFRS